MKKLLLFIVLLSVVSFANGQSQVLFNTSLETVTVYRSGAELNHTVKVNLPAGSSEIILGNIANTIDQNSIQLSAPANVTILSTTFVRDYLKSENKSAGYIKVEDSLNIAKKDLNTIQNKKSVDENLLVLLDKNQTVGGVSSGLSVAELIKMADYYKAKQLELKNSIYGYQVLETKQQSKISKLQQQLNELSTDKSGTKGQLLLQIVTKEATAAVFNLSYLSPSASWVPFYDLRAENTSTPLKIVYKANVVQYTGVDWKKVKLSLSTATPSQNGTAPLLSAWFLRFGSASTYRTQSVQNTVQAMESRAPMKAGSDRQTADVVDRNLATANNNILNTSFDLDIPYDILSNSKAHSVTLNTYNQPVNYKYYSVPKLESEAFLLAELANYEKLNLLPGDANIIFENTYVGKSFINPNATSDTLNLSMGRDKKIVVKREKVAEQSGTKLLGSIKKQTFTYEIRLRNGKSEAVNLLLKDQYPVSTDKSIEIELISADGASVNAETGVLTWKLTLKPGVTEKVRISYSVKYPKDQSIENL
ncbi:MAG: mucoidy inhibitor MuiA family protein [Flavobacterium sp.]|nr:MAG: mucoidy inhibitor MuiA family protein [Flavobacterium sp.]